MNQKLWALVWGDQVLGCFDSYAGARMALSELCRRHRLLSPFEEPPAFGIRTGEINIGPECWDEVEILKSSRRENHAASACQ